MAKFYDLFPNIGYDITKDKYSNLDYVTNIFLRLGLLTEVKNNSLAYYEYLVRDHDTPEIIADKYYGDPEYHWIVLMMNDMVNPLFDWPKTYNAFNAYIIDKYGSLELAKTQPHHYEKIIKRTDMDTNVYNEIILEIDKTMYDSLPEYAYEVIQLKSGKSIKIEISTKSIDCYSWEDDENEKKRNIKLLKKEHVPELVSELQKILSEYKDSGINKTTRRIVR